MQPASQHLAWRSTLVLQQLLSRWKAGCGCPACSHLQGTTCENCLLAHMLMTPSKLPQTCAPGAMTLMAVGWLGSLLEHQSSTCAAHRQPGKVSGRTQPLEHTSACPEGSWRQAGRLLRRGT